ncbi:ABC transporter substrate-binding protein [Muricomes intestini]|uniref:ABC-type glycerol-3-phosphate transport system substrate-binding protein n=2 Tax=Muricomes intestini TaxID=1796634 RepID=A0A4R3KGQ5_9FIRM|nr:extracellular solute-binding protein [Muricomes intestini]TCS82209.1 ABC-type glycerol-3-phosphate transport system substrate-binding protein [Muricomes intestini]
MKKRLLALALASALITAMAGCGSSSKKEIPDNSSNSNSESSSTASKEKQTIEFWMLPLIDEVKIKEMVDEFNAQSETTQVNLNVLPWTDGRDQIKQAVAAGSGPDVFYLSAGLDSTMVEADLLLPLEQNGYTEEEIDRYDSLIDASIVEDHLYAAPISYEAYLMYYRTDIMKEYGFDKLPESWDEVKTMAAAITKQSGGDVMGFQFKGADDQLNAINYSWENVFADYGGEYLDMETMTSTENSEAGVKALEFMKSFYSKGISDFGTSANTAFREGALAMYCFTNGPLISEKFVGDKDLEGKWTVGPMLGSSGYVGGHALCASAATKYPENCVEFMKWFTSPEKAPVWMSEVFGIQPYNVDKLTAEQKAAIDEMYQTEPVIWEALNASAKKASVELFSQARYGYTARWDAQKRLIISALNGEMEVEDVLKQIDLEVNQSM